MQNIGAYGQEVADTLVSLRAWDRTDRAWVDIPARECGLAYRTSVFKGRDRHVITSVTFKLRPGGSSAPIRYAELARALGVELGSVAPLGPVRDTILELRRSKGMVVSAEDPESRSAGSFFVNVTIPRSALETMHQRAKALGAIADGESIPHYPAGAELVKVPSAWLIERAGFRKGDTHAGIGISHKHALALVNRGGTTRDLLDFAAEIQARVHRAFGVELTREPVWIGPSTSPYPS